MALNYIAVRTFKSKVVNATTTGVTTMDMDDSIYTPVTAFLPFTVLVRVFTNNVTSNASFRINSNATTANVIGITAITGMPLASGDTYKYQPFNLTSTAAFMTPAYTYDEITAAASMELEITTAAVATTYEVVAYVVGVLTVAGY